MFFLLYICALFNHPRHCSVVALTIWPAMTMCWWHLWIKKNIRNNKKISFAISESPGTIHMEREREAQKRETKTTFCRSNLIVWWTFQFKLQEISLPAFFRFVSSNTFQLQQYCVFSFYFIFRRSWSRFWGDPKSDRTRLGSSVSRWQFVDSAKAPCRLSHTASERVPCTQTRKFKFLQLSTKPIHVVIHSDFNPTTSLNEWKEPSLRRLKTAHIFFYYFFFSSSLTISDSTDHKFHSSSNSSSTVMGRKMSIDDKHQMEISYFTLHKVRERRRRVLKNEISL